METSSDFRFSKVFTIVAAVLLLTTSLGFSSVQAQQSLQVDVLHIPPVLPTPFVSDFEHQVRGGRYQLQVNYTGATTPVEVEFEFRMFKDRELIVEEVSEPATVNPGFQTFAPIFDHLNFEAGFDDVVSGLSRDLQSTFIQTGAFPEGRYRVEVDAHPVDRRILVNSGRTDFEVRYPPPPRITSPTDGSDITQTTPVLSWTPVLGAEGFTMEYEVLIVELFDGQSPEEAIDANRPQVRTTVMDATSLVYTQEFLPLEEGARYAIQVTAHDIGDRLPIRNEGESEIHIFSFMGAEVVPGDLAKLEEIELVPDVAYLRELNEGIEFEDTGEFYELNGQAEVDFEMSYLPEPLTTTAHVQGLRIQKTGLDNPVVTGGGVDMEVDGISDQLLAGIGDDWLALTDMQYEFGVGIEASAAFEDDRLGTFEADGEVNLTPMGLDGMLVVDAKNLYNFTSSVMQADVNGLHISLPSGQVAADTDVRFFGETVPCDLHGFDPTANEWAASWNCEEPIVPDMGVEPDLLSMQITRSNGSVSLDREEESLDYDINARMDMVLGTTTGDPCGVRVNGAFEHGGQPQFTVLQNSCAVPDPTIDLGFALLEFSDIKIEQLEYYPDPSSWDFDISFYGSLAFPLFGDWAYEPDERFHVTQDGIDIPAFSAGESLPDYEHDGVQLAMDLLEMQGFTFPWFEWDESEPGDWNLTFEGQASIDDVSGLPLCLSNAMLEVENGQVTSGSLSADLEMATLSNCAIKLTGGHRVVFSAMGGSLNSEFNPGDEEEPVATLSDLFMEGYYEAGNPLSCSDNGSPQTTTAEIDFSGGILEGELSAENPGCDIPVGPLHASLNDVSLQLWGEDDEQQAHLSSSATLFFSMVDQIDGSLIYDIMNMSFVELDFLIDEPFTWDIPSDDPVLSFYIDEAMLGLDGLQIDGRHEVFIGDESSGVTFDELVHDIEERTVTSGRVLFDESFAFIVSFDEGLHAPDFSAVPLPEDEDFDPDLPDNGLYMELGSEVGLDSDGIYTSGDGEGIISITDLNFDQLTIQFTDNFAFQLDPFKVGSGQVDFYYNDTRVAYLDETGLNPLISGFAEEILPEKLPLPSTQVAYLLLRDAEGELLVDFDEPEPGLIQLQTKPGEQIDMMLPVMDQANPPALSGVAFDDFTITATPGNFQVDGGNVSITIDEGSPLADLKNKFGFPFDLRKIQFGDTDALTDSDTYLQLLGDLLVFDQPLTGEDNMLLKLSGSGLLTGEFDLPDLDTDVPVVPDSERLLVGLNSFSGTVATPVLSGGGLSYNFDLDADFILANPQTITEKLASLSLNMQPGSFNITDFTPSQPDSPFTLDLPGFDININEIVSMPVLDYSSTEGWDWEVELDGEFAFSVSDKDPFTIPMKDLLLHTGGFTFPKQTINESNLDGLQLPTFELAGFEFTPFQLQVKEEVEFFWFDGSLPDVTPYLDFEVYLPDFDYGSINPPDGFTFTDVTIQDGFLNGDMQPVTPGPDMIIPVGPSDLNPPEILIEQFSGALEAVEEAGETVQNVDISLEGKVENIPFFEDPDPACEMDVEYALEIVGGEGIYGAIDDIEPCGSVTLGPATLSAGTGSLNLSYEEDEQKAVFDGTLIAELQGPQNDVIAQGSVELDLIAGQILDGQVVIDEPFKMSKPFDGPSFLDFQVNEAELSQAGFMIDAQGHLQAGQTEIDVVFDQLTFSMPEFDLVSGHAEVSAGFGLQVGFSPLAVTVTDAGDQQPPDDDALVMVSESAVIIDADGLNYEGHGGASLRLGGEELVALHIAFEDDFTYSTHSPAVEKGRAEFYTDDDEEDLLATYDKDGFSFVDALIAQLPDTLGLPTSEIAYAIIKDEEGELVIDAESKDGGGYTLNTEDEPLAIHFPALADQVEGEPQVDAHFSLTTDDNYVPNGGTISLVSPMELEPYIELPVTVDSVGVDSGELATMLSVELPEVFGEEDLTVMTAVNSSGFTEAEIEFGTHIDQYDPGQDPAVVTELGSTLSGDTEESTFMAGLYGASFSINSPASFELSGFAETSLLENHEGHNYPVFFSGGYDDGWNLAAAVVDDDHESAGFGLADLDLDEHEALSITTDEDQFVLTINGALSFEEMLGEDLRFAVQNLRVGASNLQDSAELVFGIDEATMQLDEEQTFSFFEDSFSGSFSDASLSITGSALAASVGSGELTFLDEQMEFENLQAGTDGTFDIDVSMDEVEILGNYLVLQSAGLTRNEQDNLEASARFFFLLPDPVEQSGLIDVTLGRDGPSGSIFVETEIPDDSDFDPEEDDEVVFDLGSHVTVTLTDILLNVDPRDISDTHFALAGNVSILGNEDAIELGKPGAVEANPGISVKRNRTPMVAYNITGNGSFHFDRSLFEIEIETDVTSTNEEAFEITLNGTVYDVKLPGLEVEQAGFEGMVINTSGIETFGNFTSNGKFRLMGVATLELGTFEYKSVEEGQDYFTHTVPDGFGLELDDLENGGEVDETTELNLVEYLCFGPCNDGESSSAIELTLGGDSDGGSGSYGGKIDEILFYETRHGEISFRATGFELSIGDHATAEASLMYSADNGRELFAVGTAEMDIGGSEAAAIIAGGFSTMNEDLSFGIFAAVSVDAELPVIPGVLAVSGFGGGFFYRPQDDHLAMVYAGLEGFRDEPAGELTHTVTSDSRPGDFLNTEEDIELRFSLMLYAELEVFSVLEGDTFFEITDGYLALDAYGIVLNMDSSPIMAGTFFAGASWSEGMNVQASLQAMVEFDPIIDAGADVQFFVGSTDVGIEWGLIGEVNVELFQGLMGGGTNTIMASNDGFLLEVEMSAGIDRSALTLTGSLEGSIWNLTYDGADIPFGAYGIVGAEVSIARVISGEALLMAAFARVAGDYEMFGYGEVCGSVLGIGTCGSGWFKAYISGGSVGVDGGRGDPDFNDDLVAQAQAQADEFEQMIQDAMDGLQAELGQLAVPTLQLTDEKLAQAGYNYWTSDYQEDWFWKIQGNEIALMNEIPGIQNPPYYFMGLLNFIDFSGNALRDTNVRDDAEISWIVAEQQVEDKIETVENITEQTMERLEDAVIKAVEFESEAAQLRDEALEVLAESPANIINKPAQSALGEGNLPEFDVNHEQATEQSEGIKDLSEAIDEINDQIHAVVDSIEHNIQEMDNLLGAQYALMPTGPIGEFGQVDTEIIEISPSINAVSEHYLQTLEAIDRYYALKANRFWHQLNYALYAKSEVEDVYVGINNRMVEDAIHLFSAEHNSFAQGNISIDEIEPMAKKIAERSRILEDLLEGPELNGSAYEFEGYTAEGYYELFVSGEEFLDSAFLSELEEEARNLLLDIHILGTEKYVDLKKDFIEDEFIEDHHSFRENIIDIMVAHNNDIDNFYNLKANMYGSLYTIVDNYIQIQEEVDEELEIEDDYLEIYKGRRQEILDALEPPEITNIQVNTSNPSPHYFGSAEIIWDASHSVGITEISMDIQEYDYGSGSPGSVDEHISIGVPEQITYYSYLKTDEPEQALYYGSGQNPELQTRQVDISVRVRGDGGITARRQGTFELSVGEEGQGTSPGDNILPETTEPPADLLVDLEKYYNPGIRTLSMFNFDPITKSTELVEHDQMVYWSANPDYINVRALANETQTSIQRFDYAVGTNSRGSTNILDFTQLVGDTQRFPEVDISGSWTDLIDATTRIINMEPGSSYYLTVDVFNIDDFSLRYEVPHPIVYDDTPPTKPGRPDIPFTLLSTDVQAFPFFQAPQIEAEKFVENPPKYQLNSWEQLANMTTDLDPSLGTIWWEPSSDDRSGVSHYEYLVTNNENFSEAEYNQKGYTNEDTEVGITSGEGKHEELSFDFDDELYVYIRAVNNAGLKSEVLTYGPMFPYDPNPPTEPKIAGYEGSDNVRVYFKERSYDGESGMKGYQYSIGTSPGETDIRGWPEESDEVDHEYEPAQEWLTGIPASAPYISIPKEDLPEGIKLYFNVRGVNNQFTQSGVVSTGPVILDNEPPEHPQITLTPDGNTLNIEVDNIYDPVSGVAKVEAFVTNPDIPQHLILTSWQDIGNLTSVRSDNFSVETTFDVAEGYSVHDLIVSIRVTNAAGLQTIATEEAPSAPIFLLTSPPLGTTGLTF